jgi:hypothetical protein
MSNTASYHELKMSYLKGVNTMLTNLVFAVEIQILYYICTKFKLRKMKKLLFSMSFMALLISCKNESSTETDASLPASTEATEAPADAMPTDMTAASVPTGPLTKLTFDESSFDFGTVKDGEKVTHEYKFTNSGSEPLVISNATGSCGCTVPVWPKEAIAPGKTGVIKVAFDSAGKGTPEGSPQSKRVTITSNTDPVETYLEIKGKVVGTPAAAAPAQ